MPKKYFTNAPKDYDYGYTTEIDGNAKLDAFGQVHPGRVVEIPDEAADYQADRYVSGSYLTQMIEE